MAKTTYKSMIVGNSGRGKTYSLRNLNPETTAFINIESKPLPFLNKFKYYSEPDTYIQAYNDIIKFAKEDGVELIVLDSFSAYAESLLKTARDTQDGWDVWNFYNKEIGKLMFLIKKLPKHFVTVAHYEWIETPEGAVEKRVMVKGKEWKGMVEKEFTVVLYADMVFNKDNKREYRFVFNNDGKSSAKTPPIFLESEDEETMENDFAKFYSRIINILKQSNE